MVLAGSMFHVCHVQLLEVINIIDDTKLKTVNRDFENAFMHWICFVVTVF